MTTTLQIDNIKITVDALGWPVRKFADGTVYDAPATKSAKAAITRLDAEGRTPDMAAAITRAQLNEAFHQAMRAGS